MKSLQYFLALCLTLTMIGCASTTTPPTQEKPPLNSVIEAIKQLQLPK